MDQSNSAARWTWRGCGIGTLIAGPAIFAAIFLDGAGHGSYVAARVLFPYALLMTRLEGRVGPAAIGLGLLQLPLYGALVGRAVALKTYRTVGLAAVAHLVAVFACFSDLLTSFS